MSTRKRIFTLTKSLQRALRKASPPNLVLGLKSPPLLEMNPYKKGGFTNPNNRLVLSLGLACLEIKVGSILPGISWRNSGRRPLETTLGYSGD